MMKFEAQCKKHFQFQRRRHFPMQGYRRSGFPIVLLHFDGEYLKRMSEKESAVVEENA